MALVSLRDNLTRLKENRPPICTLSGAVIRRFHPRDQAQALALHQNSMATVHFQSQDYLPFFESSLRDIHQFYFKSRPRQDFVVLEYQGKIVGMGGLENTGVLIFSCAQAPDALRAELEAHSLPMPTGAEMAKLTALGEGAELILHLNGPICHRAEHKNNRLNLYHMDGKTAELVHARADPELGGHHISAALVDELVLRARNLKYSCLVAYTFHGAMMKVLQDASFSELAKYGSDICTWVGPGEFVRKYQKTLD